MDRPDIRRDVEVARSIGGGISALERLSREDREFLRADWLITARTCEKHGGDLAECVDDHAVWYPQRTVCIPAMELAAVEARYDEVHKELPFHDGSFVRWAAERSDSFPYHFRDGVTLSVALEEDTTEDLFAPPHQYAGEDIDDEGR